MELLSFCNLKPFPILFPRQINIVSRSIYNFSPLSHNFNSLSKSCLVHAKKKNSQPEPVLRPTIVDEVSEDDEDELLFDDLEDDALIDNDEDFEDDDNGDNVDFEDDNGDDVDFEDDYNDDEAELYSGDGAGGGGISLAGTWWDKEALALAEEVIQSFDGELGIYAFRTLLDSSIKVRIEKLSNGSGSLCMEDIEAFSTTYSARLEKAGIAKTVPDNISLEVSSPGAERVVRVPDDFDRFKDRPMYVKYVNEAVTPTDSPWESDGVLKLVSYDMETKCCTWGLADVKINREKAGKGRPLSKKQREWRLTTPFDSLRLVRLYSEI